jgi:hypothetical protein
VLVDIRLVPAFHAQLLMKRGDFDLVGGTTAFYMTPPEPLLVNQQDHNNASLIRAYGISSVSCWYTGSWRFFWLYLGFRFFFFVLNVDDRLKGIAGKF